MCFLDKVTTTGDCYDDRPDVYPGAPELCDYYDNDCDWQENQPPFANCSSVVNCTQGCIKRGPNFLRTIGNCNPGFYNFDGITLNGCECADQAELNGQGNTCEMALDLGRLSASIGLIHEGSISLTTDQDWVKLTFPVRCIWIYRQHIMLRSKPGMVPFHLYHIVLQG